MAIKQYKINCLILRHHRTGGN